jgi:large subunit ribosomal protein L29
MKVKEIRELSDAELEQKLTDTRQELFNLRFQSVTGALENPARITLVKRDIARIITIRAERQAAPERQ